MALHVQKYNRKYTPSKSIQDKYRQRIHKSKEVFIVSFSDTIIHPWTMVVKILVKKEKKKEKL